MMKKRLILNLFLILVCSILFAEGAQEGRDRVENETIVLTDNIGREVELPYPVTRAAVALRYNNELIRACGAIDYVIAADMNTAQDRKYWKNFSTEDVIGKSQRDLNYEKIIKLDPQVLILPYNGAVEEAVEKLSPFGIKVFVISGYDTADFENQVNNIGKMFNTEEKAEKFYRYYQEPFEYIQKQLKGVPGKTIFFETTRELGTSFPGGYYYNMVEFAGAENIFSNPPADLKESEIDPEAVIKANPEYIVKNITPDKALSGTGVYAPPPLEQRQAVVEKIKNRPGWDEISAVQNDNVYLMSQFGHGGASKRTGALYIAKWLYPEELSELDPDEYFRAWLEDFQGFEYVEGHFYPQP